MRGFLKGGAWILSVLLIALIICFGWGRLRPASPAQAEALAALQPRDPPAQERNAWATFWLIDYDVPADQVDAVYAQERQHLSDWVSQIDPEASSPPEYGFPAAAKYPKRAKLADANGERLCRSADADCLTKLREQKQRPHDVLVREASRLEALRSLTPDDFLWDDTEPSPYMPIPGYAQAADLLRTSAAMDFIEGRREQGLAEACRHVHVARQLHARTNSLIGAMVMVSWVDSAERLFAGMLAEWPDDQAVPEVCAQAFAPVTLADVDMCALMQREFAWFSSGMAIHTSRANAVKRAWFHLLLDREGTRRLMAPRYAWACQTDVREAMLADRRLGEEQAPLLHADIFDGVSNVTGVILASIDPAGYVRYMNRTEDFAAGLRLTALLLQARNGTALAVALSQMPSAGEAPRAIRIDPDGRYVRLSYYVPHGGRNELVLPVGP